MTSDWVDFRQLKERTSIERVTVHYGVSLRRVGSELRGRCPLPVHTSHKSLDSFRVNVDRNVWSCHSASCVTARDGRLGGNVLDFVVLMEHCSAHEAALLIRDRFGASVAIPDLRRVIVPTVTPEPNHALGFVLRDIDYTHPYLTARSIQPDTARTFGAGFYRGRGLLQGRVVIPIRNENNELLAYAGRSVDGAEPKYRFPTGFRKSQVLFNLNRACLSGQETAVVVEGFFDAMKVRQAGHRNVVALMGSTISDQQAALLATHFSRAVLMLDGDQAGRHGSGVIADRLHDRMDVAVIHLGEGRQPDQLASKEINQLIGAYCREDRSFGMGR
jgi:DNA primase